MTSYKRKRPEPSATINLEHDQRYDGRRIHERAITLGKLGSRSVVICSAVPTPSPISAKITEIDFEVQPHRRGSSHATPPPHGQRPVTSRPALRIRGQ